MSSINPSGGSTWSGSAVGTLAISYTTVLTELDRGWDRLLYINSRVEHDTGMPPAAFIGKTTQEVGFPEGLVSLWQTTIEQVFETAQEQEFEFELPSLEKVTHYFSRVVPEFGSDGSVESVLVICRDTTERKQAEAALQRRVQVESLLSSISQHFIDQDVDTAIKFPLQAIAQFIGAEQSCMFGLSDQRYGYLIHEWGAVGIEPIPSEAGAGYLNEFPLFNQLLSGNAFQIPCVAELSPDLPERMLFESMSIQSVVVVPMIHAGKVVGYIGADTVHFSRSWSQEDINLTGLVK